jgi:glutathione S-transferase
MLEVHAGFEIWGVADLSPPCLKLKTYLRMADIPYVNKGGDPRKGPTKKIPFVVDDGKCVGDSALIIDHLKKKHGDPLDGRLSAEERATGHVIRRTVEDSLYWLILYPRWFLPAGIAEMKKAFAPVLPPVIGGLVFSTIVKQTQKSAWSHGTGRHREEDVYAMGRADLDALSTLLGDKPYLFGESPTSYDACVYGTVANNLAFPIDNPLKQHGRSLTNLIAFCERVQGRYWKKEASATTKAPMTEQAAAPA